MSGLGLISTYTSDTEDEEIDRDNHDKPNEVPNRLPLPGSIATWKGVPHHEEIKDDPCQHEGRVRSFKHERGNWATLVYIDYTPSESMLSWMISIMEEMPVKCNIFSEQFHISITRTLILKFHWIEPFVNEIKKLCDQTDQFPLELLNIKVYCNEEKSRTFLGIECIDSNRTLTHFVKDLNNILSEYELPPFYEDSSYHISFLWCLGNESIKFNDCTSLLTIKLNQFLAEHAEDSLKNMIHYNLYEVYYK
ncbi:U6 snRNA phosphodiesterase 1 isoform X2 [Calliopsis andreniformis]|uniref:U6 snRNA phosphodiesterase 1 isoform X2 n=1 Tax=Calliopsis andreniformis TaxID=337506 RepID=UPI003FCC435B